MLKRIKVMSGLAVFGAMSLGSVAYGAVPELGKVTDDTALYQDLSEIRVAPQREMNLDRDVARLSHHESKYTEALPSLIQMYRVKKPASRIQKKQYRFRK